MFGGMISGQESFANDVWPMIMLQNITLVIILNSNKNSINKSRLEEVIVTAQKVEEGLSEVPISIQVVSSERLEDIGTTSWEELAAYVPGLQVAKGVQEQSIYMRGVGSGTNKGFEQSVTQFVDNMPVTRSQQYTAVSYTHLTLHTKP